MNSMDDVFNNLESNDSLKVEEAKIELTKSFSLTRESWLVCGMMDYFNHVKSERIVDVLVKVQTPHDGFIFDKLLEWVNTSKRNQAFELFWHIVKKHPSWLYKVASHQFFREILRVLKTEQNIITALSGLFCLLILIPIIPTQIPPYLPEMFDIFMYLAAWRTKNEPELTGKQMIHLQMGILKLFQTLYAMYPCNFTAYLRGNTKENQTVFAATINPLLDTVKMHPMLLASNKDSEKQRSWKEMEPHDVVAECSKFAVDDADNCRETDYRNSADAVGQTQVSYSVTHTPVLPPNKSVLSPFNPILTDRNRNKPQHKMDTIWSPSYVVLATPPPTNVASHTHTPTPTPITPVYGIQTIHSTSQQYQPTGASPPEAAVEATPETTPMKEFVKTHRPYPIHSSAARTIWNTSQPSSPMKKEENASFRFESDLSTGVNSPKLLKLINDRNMSQQLLFDRHHTHKESNSNQFDIEIQHAVETETTTIEQQFGKIPSIETSTEESQEDLEVHEITTRHISQSQTAHQVGSDSENGSNETLTDRKQRKTLAQCYQKANVESFDLYRRRRADHDNHSESDEDVCNRNISKSWPGLKLKMPRSENRAKHANNGNSPADLGAIEEAEMCSVAIQTTEQYPPDTYEHMYAELLADEVQRKKSSPQCSAMPMSPHNLLDQYIEMSTKKLTDSSLRAETDTQLLTILLQYERYRRDVYAERNRRLLGKCRDSAALKMDNDKLKVTTETLKVELQTVSQNLNKARLEQSSMEQENFAECTRLRSEVQTEREKNKLLEQKIEALQRSVKEETESNKDLASQLEKAHSEIFDLKNLLKHCQQQVELGNQYKEEVHRLQAEIAVLGDIQMRCRDKMMEISSAQARDHDLELFKRSYSNEMNERRALTEQKSAQLETARERVSSLESQIMKKDHVFTEKKKELKLVKEEYQEKMNALDAKYTAQKAIILKLEETILDLYRYKAPANSSTQDSEKTDMVGSLDHTSPLSISLTSSDGLSASLRSVTEIKNLQALVISTVSDSMVSTTRPTIVFASNPTNGVSSSAVPVPVNNRAGSDDLPMAMPIPGSSQNLHSHHLHHHK